MYNLLNKSLIPLCACCCAVAQDTHYSLANEVVELLSQTEICLNMCRDEQSVQEVIPHLEELRELAHQIKERQQALQDITPKEDKKIAKLIRTYITLDRAISEHLRRLSDEGLISEDLSRVLGVPMDISPCAPTTTP